MNVDFEKVLKEKLSPETFALISADEQVFGKWIERLKAMGEDYKKLLSDKQRSHEVAEKCIKIAIHYGYGWQSRILQEECAELIQAVNKHHRKGDMDGLIEEMADVQIMMMQVLYLLSIDNEKYRKIIMSKIDRQLERIGGV